MDGWGDGGKLWIGWFVGLDMLWLCVNRLS